MTMSMLVREGHHTKQDVLMFCDGCDIAMHTYCVGLATVPLGLWFCPQCRDTHTSNDDAAEE